METTGTVKEKRQNLATEKSRNIHGTMSMKLSNKIRNFKTKLRFHIKNMQLTVNVRALEKS